jgi:hypothetical protein
MEIEGLLLDRWAGLREQGTALNSQKAPVNAGKT